MKRLEVSGAVRSL